MKTLTPLAALAVLAGCATAGDRPSDAAMAAAKRSCAEARLDVQAAGSALPAGTAWNVYESCLRRELRAARTGDAA